MVLRILIATFLWDQSSVLQFANHLQAPEVGISFFSFCHFLFSFADPIHFNKSFVFGSFIRKATLDDCLQPGNRMVAAGYCMYGSSTQMVLTTKGRGVNIFTLDPALGEFLLTHPNVRIPNPAKTIYSVNEGNSIRWDKPTSTFVDEVKTKQKKKPYSLRYVGSMVADVHSMSPCLPLSIFLSTFLSVPYSFFVHFLLN